jgi:hypothetical protein
MKCAMIQKIDFMSVNYTNFSSNLIWKSLHNWAQRKSTICVICVCKSWMYEFYHTNLLVYYMAKERDLVSRINGKQKESRERESQTDKKKLQENKTI